jgi:PAS domain S-box-containing protein
VERPAPDADVLRGIWETAPVGVALVTAPGVIAWANPAYFATTGRSPTMLGTDYHAIPETDGTWSPEIRRAMDAALERGLDAAFHSVRALYRERPLEIYLDVDIRALPRRPGEPARAVLLIRDVTDRVAEQRRAELFYASFRSSTNVMQLTDAQGIMVDVNPAYERVYGYTREECIGHKPNLVRSRHTPKEVYERMWADLLDPQRGYWSGEILNRDRRGRERPVLLSITAIRDAAGVVTHYLGVAVDLSEQRRWELRAAHADKLASVGQLAAGVAHEINTPLANVILIAESLRRRSTDPWVLERVDRMTGQVELAARIVRGLLDFARREEPHAAELDLVSIARESLGFLSGKQSPDVEIEEVYSPDPVLVLGDRHQLMQVVTNVLNNAYDAMAGSGKIRLSVRARGDRAELEVLDHGPGIPAEALPHIFEPFFTTKAEGQGTGLGLAISHGIVASHHGTITARNVAGAGAAFVLDLPLRPAAAAVRGDAARTGAGSVNPA